MACVAGSDGAVDSASVAQAFKAVPVNQHSTNSRVMFLPVHSQDAWPILKHAAYGVCFCCYLLHRWTVSSIEHKYAMKSLNYRRADLLWDSQRDRLSEGYHLRGTRVLDRRVCPG